jgi:hypothetical protein
LSIRDVELELAGNFGGTAVAGWRAADGWRRRRSACRLHHRSSALPFDALLSPLFLLLASLRALGSASLRIHHSWSLESRCRGRRCAVAFARKRLTRETREKQGYQKRSLRRPSQHERVSIMVRKIPTMVKAYNLIASN